MDESIAVGLASTIVLGIAAQWFAWRLRLPSILLLLSAGFVAGPGMAWLWPDGPRIDPDHMLGDLLLPFVSLAVAVILFDGGLSLRLRELGQAGTTVVGLITLGAAITWAGAAIASRYLLQLNWDLAALFGAILVVTGPTVIIPLLRQVKTTPKVAAILKWEGILIDPIGATLAVLTAGVILKAGTGDAATLIATGLGRTILVGTLVGVLAAGLIVLMLWRYWVPDLLHSGVILAMVIGANALANHLQSESGLLAATVMGVVLANQRLARIRHVIEFKESLGVVLVSVLFILLASRLTFNDLREMSVGSLGMLGVMVLLVRPAAVLASTLFSSLRWQERVFLACVAPRGIVAAAVTSVFALELMSEGVADAHRLVPLMFVMIVGTIIVYGLGAGPAARLLKLSQANPQGVLMVGAHPLARELARILHSRQVRCLLVDSNRRNVRTARMAGLEAIEGSILSESLLEQADLSGVGKIMAITPNSEANALAADRFVSHFGSKEVYRLPVVDEEDLADTEHAHGRPLFSKNATFGRLNQLFGQGATVKATKVTQQFTLEDFRNHHGKDALPLFVHHEDGRLTVVTQGQSPGINDGDTLIALIPAVKDQASAQ
ncbi:MAG: hypothetical protein GC164_16300 [Phycisphaera sp.]|nr:hypothetical protein [Phycisphaera sp.]